MDCGVPDLSWSNGASASGNSTMFGAKQKIVCPFGFLFSKDNIQEKEIIRGIDAKWHNNWSAADPNLLEHLLANIGFLWSRSR